MKEIPKDYVLAKSIFDFVDINPLKHEEGYSPYYGMTYLIWDDEANAYLEYVLDEKVQDYELEPDIKKGNVYVPKKEKRQIRERQRESSPSNPNA